MLIDRYGRPMKNLRIAVTDRCNLSCIYCHREGIVREQKELLNAEELKLVVSAALSLGIDEVKITGGEPLIRDDIVEVVKALAELKLRDLSMTTNGVKLSEYASKLASAGLKRVNISLPSLKSDRFRYITRNGCLHKVLKGIDKAIDADLRPITINIVVLKNINEDEVDDFINFAEKKNLRLRFIELEPIVIPRNIYEKLYIPLTNIERRIALRAVKKYVRELHARPVYVLDTGIEVEFVRWINNPAFCLHCNRVRLDPDGILRPCINVLEGIDLKPYLRPTPNIDEIRKAFIKINELRRPFYS